MGNTPSADDWIPSLNKNQGGKSSRSSSPAPFYGLSSGGGAGGGSSSRSVGAGGAASPPHQGGGDMANGGGSGGSRISDTPEIQAAITRVRQAISADEAGRMADALGLYQEAVALFLEVLKKEKDPQARSELTARVDSYLKRAESLKQLLASQPPPVPPHTKAGDKKRGAPSKPPQAARKGSLDSHHVAHKPDDYDYTAEARKVSSVGSGLGGHKRTASGPTRAGVAGGRTGGTAGRGGSAGRASPGGGRGQAAVLSATPQASNDQEAIIMSEMLDRSPGVTWDDIAGLQVAKQTLQEAVVLPNLRPDLFTGLRSPPRGVLLFGPPGTGKTLLAKAVASESGFAFFSISASSLVSKYLGDGEKMVRALFSVARKLQPAVIFMDEIDSILSARRENEHEASRRLKTEFLVQLDGAATDSSDRILVMGATNLPWALDEAVLRRMPKKIYIPLPDGPARRGLIAHVLSSQKHVLKDRDMDELVRATEGYSCSDLTAVCKEAAMQPIRDLGSHIRTASVEELRPLRLNDFIQAVGHIRASVSTASIQQFEAWHRDNGYAT